MSLSKTFNLCLFKALDQPRKCPSMTEKALILTQSIISNKTKQVVKWTCSNFRISILEVQVSEKTIFTVQFLYNSMFRE